MKKFPVLSHRAFAKVLLGMVTCVCAGSNLLAQSNPTAQSLPFSQDFSGLAAATTTYPAGFQGWDISTAPGVNFSTTGPAADRAMTANGTASSTSGGVYNYNGKIGFLNSGSLDETICLAINTTGASSAQVQYDIMTIRNPYDGASNTRSNAVVLQYRVGTSGAWTSISGTEYTNILTGQTSGTTPQNTQTRSTILPPACDNQAVVQLRWASRQLGGAGSRPSFAIDNITVASSQAAPSISIPPSSVSAYSGSIATFTVSAGGTAPLSYFWYKNNVLVSDSSRIFGSSTSTLVISNLVVGDAADYVVVITNSLGSVTSAPATLSVSDSAPIFVSQPVSRSSLVGTPVTFSATVDGSRPFVYRWQKNGANLADDGRIVGSATSSLTITNVLAGDAGDYTLAVTNPVSGTVSSPGTLSVGTSGVLVGWDFNGSFNTTNPVASQGSSAAVASLVSVVGFSNNIASGLDFGSPNNAWGTSTYPNQGTSNKQAGVQFKVSTAGFKDISVSFDQRITATGSRYTRLQYTTNGTSYIDFPLSSDINPNNLTNNANYQSRSFNLAGFPGARNNPDFAVRMVSEFESTAKYGASTNANYFGNTGGYSASGTITYDVFNISAVAITDANTPPTVSTITNRSTLDTSPIVVDLSVDDIETSAGSLSVTAVSGNTAVLNDGQISPGGSGANRTLTITPTAGLTGVVPIIVTVTDGSGDITKTWFYLTINPGNFAPTISALPHTNTLTTVPLTIPFTIGDDQTAVGSLTLSETSFNTGLVPDANIVFGGSGSNRTVTITPAANQIGVAAITITLNDNDPLNPKTSTASFTVMVRASTNVIFNDFFTYPDGSILSRSFNLWQNHSGTAGQMQVTGNELVLNPSNSEDVNVPLLGQRFSTNSSDVLYSSFQVRFTALPANDGGSYFAHFKDDNTGAATGFGARVWASTLNATSGFFRLGIGNGANATNTSGQFPVDLSLNTNYTVVTKFVPATGLSTIWINPASETDLNITANDVGTVARPNPIDVLAYAFRESGAEGTKTIDNLKVGLSFEAVTGIPSAIPLAYQRVGTNIVFTWGDPTFALQAAPDVTGVYTNVSGATSPYTNAVINSRQFFRLKK